MRKTTRARRRVRVRGGTFVVLFRRAFASTCGKYTLRVVTSYSSSTSVNNFWSNNRLLCFGSRWSAAVAISTGSCPQPTAQRDQTRRSVPREGEKGALTCADCAEAIGVEDEHLARAVVTVVARLELHERVMVLLDASRAEAGDAALPVDRERLEHVVHVVLVRDGAQRLLDGLIL